MTYYVTPGLTPEPLHSAHMIGRRRRQPLVSYYERDGIANFVRPDRTSYHTTATQSLGSWSGIKHTRTPFRYKSVPGRIPNILAETTKASPVLTHRPINVSNNYEDRMV